MEELNERSFDNVEIALFSAGGSTSMHFAPIAKGAGCVVVDNSSTFRMSDDVPLVIPEINPQDAKVHNGIIANPNCTTIIALMALYPLHQKFGVRRIIASSYQAVSGSGAAGIEELDQQMKQLSCNEEVTCNLYPSQIACNVLPLIGTVLENGYSDEEMKMENEGRKILHHPDLKASVTCVRIPVYRAHSLAISAEFTEVISIEEARKVLDKSSGIDVIDNPDDYSLPMPLIQSGKDNCAVGRIRMNRAFDNGLSLWVCGDQVRKGAALNAVQIAELIL